MWHKHSETIKSPELLLIAQPAWTQSAPGLVSQGPTAFVFWLTRTLNKVRILRIKSDSAAMSLSANRTHFHETELRALVAVVPSIIFQH